MPITDEQLKLARELRRVHRPWAAIAREFGVGLYVLRAAMDSDYAHRELMRSRARKRNERRALAGFSAGRVVCGPAPERNPIYDPMRDGPLPEYETITAAFCKDPRPGRSALDQREGRR